MSGWESNQDKYFSCAHAVCLFSLLTFELQPILNEAKRARQRSVPIHRRLLLHQPMRGHRVLCTIVEGQTWLHGTLGTVHFVLYFQYVKRFFLGPGPWRGGGWGLHHATTTETL